MSHIENMTRDEKLAEAMRSAGIDWHRKHDRNWRDKPWMDGISMDLDEDEHVAVLIEAVNRVLAEAEIGL